MSGERATKDGPFAWLGKTELRLIADACDGRKDRAHVLAVYLALAWFASDKQSAAFSETIARIAERAGVSYRKAADVLDFLDRLAVVAIKQNVIAGTKERGPNTYTLRTVCSTSGTVCRRLGTGENRSVPRLLEESPEESPELSAPAGADVGKIKSPRLPKATTPRPRDPLRDALAGVDGSDPAQVTGSAWSGIAKALKEIRDVCPAVAPDEIQRRAANYRAHFPDASISPFALAKHWARCERPPQPQSSARPEAAVRRIVA